MGMRRYHRPGRRSGSSDVEIPGEVDGNVRPDETGDRVGLVEGGALHDIHPLTRGQQRVGLTYQRVDSGGGRCCRGGAEEIRERIAVPDLEAEEGGVGT